MCPNGPRVLSAVGLSRTTTPTSSIVAQLPRNDTDELNHHGTDDLVWNEHATVCESAVHGIPVRWASGDPVQRRCCTFMTALQAEWYALRAEHCRREGAPTENGGQPRLVGNDCSVYLPDGTGF